MVLVPPTFGLPVSRSFKKDSVLAATSLPSRQTTFSPGYLRTQARWIRDMLDPQVAQDGPDALCSDELLTLDELLRKLLSSDISLEELRYSRMHLAVSEVSGKATRWPRRLVEKCDAIKEMWEAKYGLLKDLGTPLYEPGGRLHGICKAEDLSKERLLVKWLKSPDVKLSPAIARRVGDLGFSPGDWWISPLFAHLAGIIDSGSAQGGIVSDANGAYAVVLAEGDEIAGSDPETFQYQARDHDPGRYRLTSGTPESRHLIRVLRAHTLHSLWKPRAGLRYDGLHKVTDWTIKKDPRSAEVIYTISFRRVPNQASMESVLCRPWSDEVEDYLEYKRIRRELKKALAAPVVKPALSPPLSLSVDGALVGFESERVWAPFKEGWSFEVADTCTPLEEQQSDRLPDEF